MDVTDVVFTLNVFEDEPAQTITDAGTVAFGLSDERVIVVDDPATPFRVTVAMDLVPPWTEVGETEMLSSVGGSTVIVAF